MRWQIRYIVQADIAGLTEIYYHYGVDAMITLLSVLRSLCTNNHSHKMKE